MPRPFIVARLRAVVRPVVEAPAVGPIARLCAGVLSAALVAASLVVGVGALSATAVDNIVLTAVSAPSILAGESASVTLTAHNPSSTTNDYNLSYRYVLPAGASYAAGSTTPTSIDEPATYTITDSPANATTGAAAVTHQVIVWSNASDLPIGDTATLTFALTLDPKVFPVGSRVTASTAEVFANSDPRTLPKFDTTAGSPTAGSSTGAGYTAYGTATPNSTTVGAIKISKTEPSPETELMRGVHNQTTVYTLTVTNTIEGMTDGVVVVDDIPAQLEFLGCGGVDNSALRTAEYTNSGPLSGTPNPGTDCLTPYSVDTVNNPGTLTGVFTEVTWKIGLLQPGATQVITYAAGIPLLANTMTWDDAAGKPSTNGAQGSNLDNNNGAPTRQIAAGSTLTNIAVAGGQYLGQRDPSASTATVTSTATFTNKIMDLSIVKRTTSPSFNTGSTADYTLTLRSSEYESDKAMTIVDTIPNGLCPLVPDLGAPGILIVDSGATAPPSECYSPGAVSNATVKSVEARVDGSFQLTLIPTLTNDTLPRNGTLVIGYGALMRTTYQAGAMAPTVAGDSFTNTVIVDGTSTAVTDQTPTDVAVHDDSTVTLQSAKPTIVKLVLPRPTASGAVDCAANDGNYIDNHAYPRSGVLPVYQLGDKICFELKVAFSTSAETKNAQIQDFVPTGTSYNDYSVSSSSVVPASEVSISQSTGADSPVFSLGATKPGDSSGALFVAKGATLTMFVSALVTSTSAHSVPDITANLMKFRQETTTGTVYSLRYLANYGIAAPVAMALAKNVIGRSPVATISAPKNALVTEGDTATFGLDITNAGTAAAGNNLPIDNVVVWDQLPVNTVCASTSSISDGGVCTDASSGGFPASTIVWTLPAPIAAGATYRVTYALTLPTSVSINQTFTNRGSVVAFDAPTTAGTQQHYFPLDSLNPAHHTDGNTPQVDDTAAVHTAAATTAKSGTPNITEANKSATQVVAGETIDYTYSVVVPAQSTVYNAVLSDALPTNPVSLTIPANATVTADFQGTNFTPSNPPPGFTLDSSGTLTFPASYDNTTTSPAVVSVTIHGVLVGVGLTSSAAPIVNTANFRSTALAATSSAPVSTPPSTFTVAVVSPVPTLTKTVSPSTAAAGDTVTYTITASGAQNAPASFDPVVTDCLPSGLTFGSFVNPAASSTVTEMPGTGDAATNGCATTATFIEWQLPPSTTVIYGTDTVLTFTAIVGPSAVGQFRYPNTAHLVSSTLQNGTNDSAVEGVLNTTSASAIVTVPGATLVKSIIAPIVAHVIGSAVEYQLAVNLPANVNFYNTSIIDTLPTPAGSIVPDQASTVLTCTTASGADCTADLPGSQSGYALSPTGTPVTTIGWYLGTVTSRTYARTVLIRYSATIADISTNARATALSNSATVKWNNAEASPPPSSVNATFDTTATPTPAQSISFIVVEPKVTVLKKVNNATAINAEPGTSFTYSLVATNDNNSNAATAHDVVLKDIIPTGIIVDPSTISNSGVAAFTGTVVTSITWSVGDLAINSSSSPYTYSARLADSTTLSGAPLDNSATVDSYRSLEAAGRVSPASAPSVATVTPIFPSIVIGKTAASHTAYLDTPTTFTVTLTNTGLGTATTITPRDVLPAYWVLVGNPTLSLAGGAPTRYDPATTAIDSSNQVQTLQWPTTTVTLAAGQVATISYQAQPTRAILPNIGSQVAQINTVSTVATDPTGADHHASNASYAKAPARYSTHIDQADVSIAKTAGHPLVAGTTTADAWSLTVSNNGGTSGSDAAAGPFTVTDTPTLPAGVTIAGVSGVGWACSTPDAVTGAFSCTRSDGIAAAAAGTTTTFATPGPIVIAVKVAATVDSGVQVPNTATVSDVTYDPATANNSASKTLTVTTAADLSISKTANGIFTAGAPASWSLTVTNSGPSIARWPITVVDTLPTSGVIATSARASGTDWTCGDPTSGLTPTITCTYSGPANSTALGLGLGSTPTITVTATIASSTTTAITNSATVSSPTADPVPANNTQTVTTQVDSTTSLTIVKTMITQPLVAGAPVTYEFAVTNQLTPDARSVVITDPLPDGLVFVSSTPVGGGGSWACTDVGTPSASIVRCVLSGTLGGVNSGNNVARVRITASTPSSLTGGVLNTATVAWTDGTSQGQDNGTTTAEADLQMIKTHASGAIYAGNTVTYSLSVQNIAGASDEPAGATVVDTLPTGLTYVGITAAQGWSCAAPVQQSLTCTSTRVIVSGATVPVASVVARVPSTSGQTTYTNLAEVSGVINDPVPSNNTAADPTVVTDYAALTITKSVQDNATTWVAGTDITYSLVVVNDGPSVANAVTVSDSLPAGLTMVSLSSADTAWSCNSATFACTRTAMDVGTSTITVVAHVASSVANNTVETNNSTVEWSDSRSTPTQVTSAVSVTVEAAADLKLLKTPAGQTATAGNDVTFSLAASNLGSSDAVGPITITDTLPVGLRYASSSAGWVCTVAAVAPTATQEVTCTLGAPGSQPGLAASTAAATLTMVTVSDPALLAVTLTNTAIVSSQTADPNESNNSSSATVNFFPSADLSITKTHSGHGLIGEITDFTIVVSNANGPSDARQVTVVDTLPRGLSFVDFTGSDPLWTSCTPGSMDAESGTTPVSCVYDPGAVIAPGSAAAALHIRALVGAAAYPGVSNVAQVSSATTDPNSANNSVTDSLVVDPLVELHVKKTHIGQLVVGENGRYLIAVTDFGPTQDPGGFSITDILPAGLSYVSSQGAGVTCAVVGSSVTCTFAGALSVQKTRSVTLTLAVGQQAYPTVKNTATVASLWPQLPTDALSSADSATVVQPPLAFTGGTVNLLLSTLIIGALLFAGVIMVLIGRRRRRVK